MKSEPINAKNLNEFEDYLFGDHKRLEGLKERNRQTLNRVVQFRREIGDAPISAEEFLKIANKHPYIGILPCFAAEAEFVMMLANDDVVARNYLWYGPDGYEPAIVNRWWNWCRKPGIVLDIGGYSGLMSILAALANSGNEIHLFEPIEGTCERARLNVKLNGFGHRICAHNIAASNRNGEAKINLFRPYNGSLHGTGSSLYSKDQENKKVVETKSVVAQKLDDYIEDFQPSVVKIDVEGHELAVLQGMKKMLERSKPKMVIEVWQHTRSDVIRFLENMGYSLHQVERYCSPVNNFFAE